MKKAFTLVELLTVLAIIVMLVGLIIPATVTVHRFAKETKQKAEFISIEVALRLFKNDYGEYPPSFEDKVMHDYSGSQKLVEALLGRDLLGFHPQSQWELSDGVYDDKTPENLQQRKSRYYESRTTNIHRLGFGVGEGLFINAGLLAPNTFVMCDIFGVREIKLANNKKVRAGTPILYYRANTTSKVFADGIVGWNNSIYNAYDNLALIGLGILQPDGSTKGKHWLYGNEGQNFYSPEYKIVDPIITSMLWPRNPESYILISAGIDGKYGTIDDITNLGN